MVHVAFTSRKKSVLQLYPPIPHAVGMVSLTSIRQEIKLEKDVRFQKETSLNTDYINKIANKSQAKLSIENKLLVHNPVMRPVWVCAVFSEELP